MTREWRIFRGAALVAVASRGTIALLGFAISVLLARTVPQGELGAYFLLVQSAVVLGIIFDCGANGANQRFVAIAAGRDAWPGVRRLLGYAGRMVGASFVIATVAMVFLWRYVAELLDMPELEPLWWALILLALGRALEELASSYYRSSGRPRTGVLLLGLPRQTAMFLGLVTVWLVRGELSMEIAAAWRAWTAIGAALLGAMMVYLHLRRQPGRGDWQPPPFTEYRQMSTTVLGHMLAAYLFAHLDLWFLGIFLNAETVGLYGVMLQLTTLIVAMMGVVNLILPPMVSRMYDDGQTAKVEALMRRVATLSGWLAAVLLVILLVWGAGIIRLLFGADYVAGHLILVVLAASQAFNIACGSPGYLLQMTGHHRTLLRITVSSLLLNGVLNLVGVYTLGAIGVALATAVTIVVQNCLMVVFARRRVGIRTYARPNLIAAIRGTEA